MHVNTSRGWLAAVLLLTSVLITGSATDVVELKDGTRVSGKILARSGATIALQTKEGYIDYFDTTDIRRIYTDGSQPATPPVVTVPAPEETISPATDASSVTPVYSSDYTTEEEITVELPFDPETAFQIEELTETQKIKLAIGIAITAIGGICQLISTIIIIIAAFRGHGFFKGLLTICCWPYWLYFALVHYQSQRKKLVLLLYFGGLILNIGGLALQQTVFFEQMMPIMQSILALSENAN